jgi:ParB-like chromosome segregation protein Spo0J
MWRGNAGLRQMLVPIGSLRPHPRNPRLGEVDEIRKSLRRFGQQRPVLALPDGTLVAGHHVWRAAEAEGWPEVAAVQSDLTDAEVDAYLLADNRLADLGLYDDTVLAELLGSFAGDLDGIGYTTDDVDQLLALIGPPELAPAPRGKRPQEMPYALGEADLYRVMLTYDQATYELLVPALEAYRVERGLDSYSDVVREAFLAED